MDYKKVIQDIEDIEKMYKPLEASFFKQKDDLTGRVLNMQFRVALNALRKLKDALEEVSRETKPNA